MSGVSVDTQRAPRVVTAAVAILWIALTVQAALSWTMLAFGPGSFITALLGIGINAFFIWMIWRRKNWARVTYLVVFLLLSFGTVRGTVDLVQSLPALGVPRVLIVLADLCALVMLFMPVSNAWFRQRSVAAAGEVQTET